MDKNLNTETSIDTNTIMEDIAGNNAAGTSEAHEDDSAADREEAEGSEAAYREECNQKLNDRGFSGNDCDREGILNFFVNYRTPGVGHSGFKLDSYLGSGSFGYTFSVKSKNANYLIKLYKNKDPYGNVIDALENRNSELEILKGINKAIQNKENISAVPHPDLLYGVGETEPPYCLVTELEEGRFTLEDWNSRFNQSKHNKQNAQRSLDSLFKAFVKLSDAVSRLHNEGYIHNDIKYNNIIYSSSNASIIEEGKVYLIDFGECVNTSDSSSTRRAGMDYDDKRSFRPPSANVDDPSSCVPSQALDIYCLCATMFRVITSKDILKIPTADGGWKPDLREVGKKLIENNVDKSFVKVLKDGLCWEKDKQIRDASELSKRLGEALQSEASKSKKNYFIAGVVIASVFAGVIAFVLFCVLVGKTDTDISTANDADGSSISSSLPSSAVNILDTDWVDEGLHEMFKRYAELNGTSVFDGKDIGVIKTIAINNNQLVIFSDDINPEKLNDSINIETINFTFQSFKDFEKFPGLKRLIIANCCLPKNEQISLRRVEFHNCDFDSFAALSKSEEIVIRNMDINGKNLNGFLSELEPETVSTLILSGFNHLDITGLHDFKKLSCLSLENIDLSGCTNELIDAIKGMDNLEELDLSGSIISDAGRLSELSTLKNLKKMTINGLKVSTGIKSINFSDLDFVNDLIFDDYTFLASIADEGVKTAFENIKDAYDGDTVFYNIRKGGYTSVVVNGGNGEDDGQNGIFFAKKIKKENSDDFDLDDFFGDKELFKMGTSSWSPGDDNSQYKSIESLDDISFIFPDAEELKIRKCPINISEECALTKFKNLTSLHISEISSIDLKVLKNPNLNKIIALSIVDVLSVFNHDALLEIGNIIDLTFVDINIGNLSLPLNLKNLHIHYGLNHEKDIADLDLAGLCKGTSVEILQLSNVIVSDNNVFIDVLLQMNGLNLLCIERNGSDKHLLSSLEGFERLNKLSSFEELRLINLSNDISDYSPLEEFMEKTNEEHDADNKTESQTWRVKK